jgi:hypothetical protein
MNFDLHFTETFRGITVNPLTSKGCSFLIASQGFDFKDGFSIIITEARELYELATQNDLHVSFDTAMTRDLLAMRPIFCEL